MPLYSPVIDWLAWIPGIGGFLCLLWVMPEPVGPVRGYKKMAAFVLLGLGILVAGIGGVLANLRAPHLEMGGLWCRCNIMPHARARVQT